MGKFDDKVAEYAKQLKDLGQNVDMDLLSAVTAGVGPNIYKADASKVSTSDQEEVDRVKNNFCMKKLGLTNEAKIQEGIDAVTEIFGKSNSNKSRAGFYYLLTKHFKKESVYK